MRAVFDPVLLPGALRGSVPGKIGVLSRTIPDFERIQAIQDIAYRMAEPKAFTVFSSRSNASSGFMDCFGVVAVLFDDGVSVLDCNTVLLCYGNGRQRRSCAFFIRHDRSPGKRAHRANAGQNGPPGNNMGIIGEISRVTAQPAFASNPISGNLIPLGRLPHAGN